MSGKALMASAFPQNSTIDSPALTETTVPFSEVETSRRTAPEMCTWPPRNVSLPPK